MTIDDETLMAFADGELDAVSAKRVERAIAADASLAARVAAHRRLKETLEAHYAPMVDEPVPAQLRALFPADNVVAFGAPARKRWVQGWRELGAMAATLVLGLFVGQAIDLGGSAPFAERGGVLVARANVAQALDTQLASAQRTGGVRIGLTFRSNAGAVCRSFAGEGLSGVACREADDWAIRQLSRGERGTATDYRQAASADPATLAAIDAMIAGEPYDAAQERDARAREWR